MGATLADATGQSEARNLADDESLVARASGLGVMEAITMQGYDGCPECGREKILVRVSQSGDAIAEDGRCVPHGTPGSEGQCLLVTPCKECAERDQSVMGSHWEDCEHDSYALVSGEAEDVAETLEADGYDVEMVD